MAAKANPQGPQKIEQLLENRVLARVLAVDMRKVNGGVAPGGPIIWCNDVREGTGVAGSTEGYSSPEADT